MAEPEAFTPEQLVKLRLLVAEPGQQEVRVERDMRYRDDLQGDLRLDVFRPDATGPRPVVVFVHGGPVPGMRPRRWAVFEDYGRLAAARGFVGVTFDHALAETGSYVEADADVGAALAYLRSNAGRLGVDPEHMAVWTFSGGGPLLASLIRARPAWLRALVAFYAVLDAAPLAGRFGVPADDFAFLSPLAQIEAGEPLPIPLTVARAGRDQERLNQTIDRFSAVALRRGLDVDLLSHARGRHGFDVLDDDARTRDIVRRAFARVGEALAAT